MPFSSSFGEIEVRLEDVESFADGELHIADGTVLKGSFGDGKIEVETSVGALKVATGDIVSIVRGRGSTESHTQPAAGQGVLIGRVMDNFYAPVRDATVRIQGSAFETSTDDNGGYQLPYVPGALVIQISLPGYDPIQFGLNLSEPAEYPVEDKFMLRLPARKGMYLWSTADWTSLEACTLKQTKAIGGKIDYSGVRKDAYSVSRRALQVPMSGRIIFLDHTQSGKALVVSQSDNFG